MGAKNYSWKTYPKNFPRETPQRVAKAKSKLERRRAGIVVVRQLLDLGEVLERHVVEAKAAWATKRREALASRFRRSQRALPRALAFACGIRGLPNWGRGEEREEEGGGGREADGGGGPSKP